MAIRITYYVHGTTIDNELDLATGWNPGQLSLLGMQQSRDLSKKIKQRFDAVFCSDLQRAVDSAKLIFPKENIIQDQRLREANYGEFNGKPAKLFKHKLREYIDVPFPFGESYEDVEARIKEFLAFLKKKYDQKHIALVAHQAPQLALDVLLKKKTWQQAIAEDWRITKDWKPGWEDSLQ